MVGKYSKEGEDKGFSTNVLLSSAIRSSSKQNDMLAFGHVFVSSNSELHEAFGNFSACLGFFRNGSIRQITYVNYPTKLYQ